jgi:hypothetical protein
MNGETMSLSKYQPVMTYLEQKDIIRLKAYAKKSKVPMAHVIRESLHSKFAKGDPFSAGFNEGVNACIYKIHDIQGAQMRFPSGKSVAELIEEELIHLRMVNENT